MIEPLHQPELNRTISAGRENAPEYLTYLQSAEWRARRNRSLRLSGYRCSRCDSKHQLQVHHLTYERLGAEWDQDLEVLCGQCHRDEHLARPDQTSLGVYLKLASVAIQDDPFGDIADLAEAIKVQCIALGIPPRSTRIASALNVCGLRLQNRTPRIPQQQPPEAVVDRKPLNHAESCELLCRLGVATSLMTSMSRLIRTMPAGMTDSEQRRHEERLAEQVARFKDAVL